MADRIEQQINNATAAIQKLNREVANLQAQLRDKSLGGTEIQKLQQRIDSLNASLTKKESRRTEIISKRDITETQRQLDSLNKSIESTRRQLEYLRSERTSRASGNAPFLDYSPEQLQKQLANYERGLRGFESRKAKLESQLAEQRNLGGRGIGALDYLGQAPGRANKEDLERALNARRLGFPLTNAEVLQKIKESRKIALDALYGKTVLEQGAEQNLTGQSQSPLGAGGLRQGQKQNVSDLQLVNDKIRETIALLRQLKKESVSTRGGVVSDEEIRQQERLNELLKQRRTLRTGFSGSGFGKGDTPHVPSQAAQDAFNKALGNEANATDKVTKAKQRQIAEEKRLQDLRTRIANDPAFKQYLSQLEARGLGLQDIQTAVSRGGGITQVTAARNQGGINNKFQGYVNERTGTSTPGLSSQFRTFGGDILRDIGQFTKWSIAIAAVYTPMQKLGELMTIMVDNESRLADAAIAANIPFEKSGDIFDRVAIAANQSGESISGVIDAYTQAIRAAGRYADETERLQKASELLNDSLILSKLSGLGQAEAIDTLSAALLQAGLQLDEGEKLLNQWVRVTQVANVNLDALSVGVAVLGDTAEASGLSVEKLNALIAVISEQSIKGGKEAANTAKALIGAYQSDTAEKALTRYGISLRRANGEVRNFLEVYQEVADLQKQGIISAPGISELSLALGGGGTRRAADATALISTLADETGRYTQILEAQEGITGDSTIAQDALAKKLETVQTANTRLANSFQDLAQTLGDDGGLLDTFKILIDLLTLGVKGANELFTTFGRSGPILATFVTGLAAMNAYLGVGGRKDVALGRLGAGQFGGFLGAGGGQFAPQTTNAFGGGLGADILRMNYRGAGFLGAAGVGLQAASNIQAGKLDNAGANVVGGAIGGAIGTALGGPIGLAIGANIGSAIGDAFLNAIFEHSEEVADYFIPRGTSAEARERARQAEDTRGYGELSTSELLALQSKELGIGGNLRAFFGATVGPGFSAYGGKKESAGLDVLQGINPELYAEIQRREAERLAKESARQADVAAKAAQGGQGEFATQRILLEQLANEAKREQLTRLSSGQISAAEFGRTSQQLSGFPSVALKSVEAFGDAMFDVNREIQNSTEAYDAFLYVATYGTQEQISLINQYSDDVLKLQSYIDTWKPESKGLAIKLSIGDVEFDSAQEAQKYLEDFQLQGATAFNSILQQVQKTQAQAVTLPPLVGDYNKPRTGDEQDRIVAEGLEIMNQFLVETGKTAEEIATFKAAIEEFYTAVDRGAGVIFESTDTITQQFYQLGEAALIAAGELGELKGFGFQQFDVDRASLERAAQQSLALGSQWAEQFPGFETKPEDLLAITNEGMVKPIHADLRILALLLEQLNEKAQKQLDGQYNIPEGATFWVPLTAAYYRRQAGSEGGLDSMLENLALDSNTNATDQNTQALREAAQAFRGDLGYSRQAQTTKERALGYRGDQGLSREAEENRQLATGYRGDLGYARRAETREDYSTYRGVGGGPVRTRDISIQQLLTELKNAIQGLFSQNQNPTFGTPRLQGSGTTGGRSVAQQSSTVTPQLNTKLDLRVSSNINLVVDGRVLANTLQSYLASELLRTEQSQGTITKRYVI